MKTLISKIAFIILMQAFASTLLAHVELDNPLGGETFTVGQTVTIEWHIAIPHNTLNWDVLFSSDGGATWAFIQMDLPVGSLSYSWVVPNNITSQARVSVIQDNSGTDYQDESMNFTIQAPPMIPFIVLGAIDTVIESNLENQDDAIQSWLDNHGGATATSFCGELIWSHDFSDLSNECGITGNALVTFMATDECGSAETTATVNVVDSSPPVFLNQSMDLFVECDGLGNQIDLFPWLNSHGGAQASDDGGTLTWSNDYTTVNDSCGSTGNTTVIFIATDECGNYSTTYATFTVEDHLSPMIPVTAQDTFIECGLPNTQAILQSWLGRHGGAIANDICGSVVWINNFSALPDTCHGTNSLGVIFTCTDECSNSNSTSAILTLLGTSGTAAPNYDVSGFTLSPNPVSHTLKITVDQIEFVLEHLTLFDACGKPVLNLREVSGEINIPVYGYAQGIYLVQAQTLHGVMRRKVIIE